MLCRFCDQEVPAGAFCGRCGARLQPRRWEGPQWMRLRNFAAAPNQGVLLPVIATTLFPRLTRQSRTAFHVGLAVMMVTLLALAALRVTPALIAVGALGIPLLFVLYLRECGAFRDIPRRQLVISAAVGATLGVGAILVAGARFAHINDISMTAGVAWSKFFRHGLAIPLGAALLKVVPAAVARVLSKPPRKALDGFAIGAAGALAFSAAATLTRLAPQFAVGWIAASRSVEGLIVEAAISGVTVPLTAAAAGGTVGVALWFTPDPDSTRAHQRRAGAILAGLTLAVLTIFVGVVATDAAGLSQMKVLLLHLALAIAAGLALRMALQIALLGEAHDPASVQARQCGFCGNAVPDTAFCPVCGVAGAAIPACPRLVTHGARLLGTWALGNAFVAAALIALSVVVTATPRRFTCPPNCGRPPIATPVRDLPRYTADDGGFTVSYPGAETAYDVTTDADGVTARLTVGDGGVLRLFAVPAGGRPPRDIANALLRQRFPDAVIDYEIPNAMVGYQLGWGAVADRWPQSSGGSYLRLRILVLVAVKNDLALVAAAAGPFREFGPDSGPGLPSGANVLIAQDMGKYVNSFRWKGDPLD